MNKTQLIICLYKLLAALMYALAKGLIAKRGITDYPPHVTVMDLFCLHPAELAAPNNTTLFLLIKSYRVEHKLAQLPSPTLPNHDIGHVWRSVNNLTITLTADPNVPPLAQCNGAGASGLVPYPEPRPRAPPPPPPTRRAGHPRYNTATPAKRTSPPQDGNTRSASATRQRGPL